MTDADLEYESSDLALLLDPLREGRRDGIRHVCVQVTDHCTPSARRRSHLPGRIEFVARSREEEEKLTALDGHRVLRTLVRCRVV